MLHHRIAHAIQVSFRKSNQNKLETSKANQITPTYLNHVSEHRVSPTQLKMQATRVQCCNSVDA